MTLPRTGVPGGKPQGGPKEKKLGRALVRQYGAADALAHAGYNVENNPVVTPADIAAGIRPNARPDLRVAGVLFDCYAPDPPLIERERARREAFDCADHTSEIEEDEDWLTPYWAGFIRDRVRAAVLERIRKHVGAKVTERQAFGVVIDLTDMAGSVTSDEVAELFTTRRVPKLQRLFIVAPATALPRVTVAGIEQYTAPLHDAGGREYSVIVAQYEYPRFGVESIAVREVPL